MPNLICLFIFVGNDDKSRNLTSLINDVEVSSKMENETFVALKLEAGSLPHTQFTEICILIIPFFDIIR